MFDRINKTANHIKETLTENHIRVDNLMSRRQERESMGKQFYD